VSEVLSVSDLTVKFTSKSGAAHTAVDRLSLSLAAGSTLAVVGESGSGKTTLLRAVIGLAEKTSGSVAIFGKDTNKLAKHEITGLRRRCGYVPQDPYGAIPPGLSVRDAVMEPALIAHLSLDKKSRHERAEALLAEFGLTGERILASRAVGLSGGQRQRVELARALMLSPELLLCDEPTSMQDVSTRGDIIDALKKRVADGMSMIFVTHDLILAGRAAERIIVMKDGRLCEEGPSAQLINSPSHPYTKALMEAVPRLDAIRG
jgi:peptide/nickel transport system ATP-binding protein